MRKKRSVPDEEGLFLLCCFIEETLDWLDALARDFQTCVTMTAPLCPDQRGS